MQLQLWGGLLVRPNGATPTPLTIDTRRGHIVPDDATTISARLDISGYAIYPGLINAHDHLELNHYPRTRFQDVYPNAHQWGKDVSQRLNEPPFRNLQALPLWDRCFSGGLKNLLSGALTVIHHNPLHRPLQQRRFPVDVVRRYGWAHSLHFTPRDERLRRYRDSAPHPFFIHLAEGTDDIAHQEYPTLAGEGLAGPRTVLIHGVGLTAAQTAEAIQNGLHLVWCPSTNLYLLGQTADITPWQAAGRLALGSDSRLTAAGDLLDELRAAQAESDLSPQELFQLVTLVPRRLAGLDAVGDLQPGMRANLILLPRQADPYQALINACRHDLALVMRNGQPLIGLPALLENWPGKTFQAAMLDGTPRLVHPRLARQLRRCRIAEPGLTLT